ncbi:hypothetical protein [Acinetobacter schindleri]|uniref:hypothetical protein n=1 Tax=Acinetobacter schindleri TaxID=108981 RepID=UPI0013D1DA38|nr:hypothetical protein [Acinetobacter schindleri]
MKKAQQKYAKKLKINSGYLILFQGSSALKSLHFAGFFILSSIFSDLILGKGKPEAELSQLTWIYIMYGLAQELT